MTFGDQTADIVQAIGGALLVLLEERTEWIDSPAYRDLRKALFPWEDRTSMPRTRREVRSGLRGAALLARRPKDQETP